MKYNEARQFIEGFKEALVIEHSVNDDGETVTSKTRKGGYIFDVDKGQQEDQDKQRTAFVYSEAGVVTFIVGTNGYQGYPLFNGIISIDLKTVSNVTYDEGEFIFSDEARHVRAVKLENDIGQLSAIASAVIGNFMAVKTQTNVV